MLSKTILVKMLEIVIFEMVIKILLFKVCKLINVKFSCVLMHRMAKTVCQRLFSFDRFDEFDEAIEEAIEEDIKEAEGGGRKDVYVR